MSLKEEIMRFVFVAGLLLLMTSPEAAAQGTSGKRCGTVGGCSSSPACADQVVGAQCGGAKKCVSASENSLAACCKCQAPTTCTTTVTDPSTVEILVQSPLEGTQSIGVSIANNVNVSIPPYSPGTFDPIPVTATKIDSLKSARVELQVCSSTCMLCDPVATLVARNAGKPETQTFSQVPDTENKVTIFNGSPGLKSLVIVVNDSTFRVTDLEDQEHRTIDISWAIVAGSQSVITLTAAGKPGQSATVLIHD
jgi:hypothetical protein